MNRDRINDLYKALGQKPTGYRSGWIESNCPLGPWRHGDGVDKHPSFGIKMSDQKSQCKCLSCGFGGDLYDLARALISLEKRRPTGTDYSKAVQLIATELDEATLNIASIPEYGKDKFKRDHVFPEEWLFTFPLAMNAPNAREYLNSRGVSDELIEFLDVRFDPSENRVCFPYRNSRKELIGVQGRAINPDDELRYKQYKHMGEMNGHAWMGEDNADFDEPLILVEGPFDLASVMRVHFNVVASFTSGLSLEKMRRIGDASEIITFYDYGKGGEAARNKLSKFFSKTPVTHLIPSQGQGDPGNMTEDEIQEIIDSSF